MQDNVNDNFYSDSISTNTGDIITNVTVNLEDNHMKDTKDSCYSSSNDENNRVESSNMHVNLDTIDDLQSKLEVHEELHNTDADFGDFDSAFAASSRKDKKDSIFPSKDDFPKPKEISIVNKNIVDDQNPLFDDSDDDFGDFGEIVTPQARPVLSCTEESLPTELVMSGNNTPVTHSTNDILNSVRH